VSILPSEFGFFCFPEILAGDPQDAEAFAVFFLQMFVVNFVGLAQRHKINVVGLAENFKTLVYKNIVHQQVGQTVEGDADPDPQAGIHYAVGVAEENKQHPRYGEDQEKRIIALKKTVVKIRLVMIPA